jgi:hypothetical protein
VLLAGPKIDSTVGCSKVVLVRCWEAAGGCSGCHEAVGRSQTRVPLDVSRIGSRSFKYTCKGSRRWKLFFWGFVVVTPSAVGIDVMSCKRRESSGA